MFANEMQQAKVLHTERVRQAAEHRLANEVRGARKARRSADHESERRVTTTLRSRFARAA
ncbi:hypothetical protein [Streptomyces sp. NBC_01304]|uniref:hypothetical protein n=1 Tax=Streptomyces sp. NBC_01304 TaxID=2903818 RepID=UPI002E1193D4|nr:hypothetical protein OG430_16520 [Streptomyces sp. NBC_01304]